MQASFPRLVLTAVALAAAASAGAQQTSVAGFQGLTTAAPESGEAWELGEGVRLYPSVSAGLGYNDNVTGVSTGKVSSSTLNLQPRLMAETQRAASRYTLAYQGNYTRFNSSTTDNNEQHSLTAAGDHVFTARSRLGWALNHDNKVDTRDYTNATPDGWRGLGARAVYRYGAEGAQGNLETEYAYLNKRYDDVSARGGDSDASLVAGRFFWRVMPKTYLVTEARYRDTDYRSANGDDNTDTRLLLGLAWDATAMTSGSFKVGHQRRDYLTRAADYSGLTYEAAVTWAPLTYSTWTIKAVKAAEDAVTYGTLEQDGTDTNTNFNFQRLTALSAGWSHQWNSRISTRATLSQSTSKDPVSGRADKRMGLGLGLSYQLGRNFSLGVGYSHTDVDSNVADRAYQRNTYSVMLQAHR